MNRPELLRSGLLSHPGLVHGFSTRRGGLSSGAFTSLNLSLRSGDDPETVRRNRRRLARSLGLERLAFADQVHGAEVLRVEGEEAALAALGPVGEGDALVTDRPGVGLVAQTADCTPVLLFDPVRRNVAAVHAGWRGVVAGIVGRTIHVLSTGFGSRAGDLLCVIGPAISRAHYRVGPEVLDAFEGALRELPEEWVGARDAEGGAGLDVPEAVRSQLVEAGLSPHRIERIPACTFSDPRFFSCRRAEGTSFGSQGAVIGLR